MLQDTISADKSHKKAKNIDKKRKENDYSKEKEKVGKRIRVWYQVEKTGKGYYVNGDVIAHNEGDYYEIKYDNRKINEFVELRDLNCTIDKKNDERWNFID